MASWPTELREPMTWQREVLREVHRRVLQVACVATALALNTNAQAEELPPPQRWIAPTTFADGLALLRSKNDCNTCPQLQEISFFNLHSATPYRTEKVSLQSRYSVAYAYPGTHVFAMLSIEQSAPAQFSADASFIRDAFIKECERQQYQLTQQGDAALAVYQSGLTAGQSLVSLSTQKFDKIELLRCDQNSLTLPGNVRSRLLWLEPIMGLRIRMNFTQQDEAPFKDMQQLNVLRLRVTQQYLETLQQAQKQFTRYQQLKGV
jgi:hypothetical protein